MSDLTTWLDQRLYPGHAKNWDDRLFRERILTHLDSDSTVLDIGAGAGIVSEMHFRGQVARICGVDLDPRVATNPMLDEGRVADARHIPYEDNTFDVAFADNVMERLSHPIEVFREINRVLKPDGVLLFKTPNKWHYMPTIARLTPHGFHRFINRLRDRAEVDTFPTLYRANTAAKVAQLSAQSGFQVERIIRVEGRPEYLRISPVTYVFGFLYERLVNATDILTMFRILLIAELRKAKAPS